MSALRTSPNAARAATVVTDFMRMLLISSVVRVRYPLANVDGSSFFCSCPNILCLRIILRRLGPGKPSTWRPIACGALIPVSSAVWPVALWGMPRIPSAASMGIAYFCMADVSAGHMDWLTGFVSSFAGARPRPSTNIINILCMSL